MTDYYVASAGNGGSDANDGLTDTTPWETITKVNATATTGDVVQFNRTDAFIGLLTPAAGGITYTYYGTGANPVIDGNGTGTTLFINNLDNVNVDNLEFNGYTTNAVWYTGTSSNGSVHGCVFKNHAAGNPGTGVRLSGTSSFITISDCYVYQGDEYGIRCDGNGGDCLIEGCVVHGQTTALPTNANFAAIYVNASARSIVRDCFIDSWYRNAAAIVPGYFRYDTVEAGYVDGLIVNNPLANNYIHGGDAGKPLLIKGLIMGGSPQDGVAIVGTSVVDLVNCNIQYATLNGINTNGQKTRIFNCNVSNNTRGGITTETSNAGLEIYDSVVANNGFDGVNAWNGIRADTGTAIIQNTFVSTSAQDGINGINGVAMTVIGCEVSFSGNKDYDGAGGDGVSVHDTCTLRMEGCRIHNNSKTGTANVGTSVGTIKNCTFHNNGYNVSPAIQRAYGDVVISETADFDMQGCILINSSKAVFAGVNYTGDNNIYYNTKHTFIFDDGATLYDLAGFIGTGKEGVNSTFEDPLLDVDYVPTISSPAYNSVSKWWQNTEIRPTSAAHNNEPYPDTNADRGGVQSTHYTTHTENLS